MLLDIFALIVWTTMAVLVGVVARARGRSGVGWFALSLFITPIFAMIVLVLLPKKPVAAGVGQQQDAAL
jgi:hypothetical protein